MAVSSVVYGVAAVGTGIASVAVATADGITFGKVQVLHKAADDCYNAAAGYADKSSPYIKKAIAVTRYGAEAATSIATEAGCVIASNKSGIKECEEYREEAGKQMYKALKD